MATEEGKSNRWSMRLPRFSVRTLTIFVLLVCAYLAAWEATKKDCVRDNRTYRDDTEEFVPRDLNSSQGVPVVRGATFFRVTASSAPIPFVIVEDQHLITFTKNRPAFGNGASFNFRRAYYLWLFGGRIRFFQHRRAMGIF